MSEKRSSFRKLLPLVTTLVLMLPLVFALAAPVSAAGTIRVDGDAACVLGSGQGDPYGVVYCKIQDAVTDANGGDTIHVYPRTGVYDEGVDLYLAGGNITLITVNNAGNPTPGTVTVDNSGDAPEFFTSQPPDANVTIDGFKLRSAYGAIDVTVDDGDVEIRNVDASGTGEDGIKVSAGGNVIITDCTASNNQGSGIYVWGTGGDVTITNCTANQNGCPVVEPGGLPECQAHGIAVVGVGGKVTITNCTTLGNGGRGIHVSPPVATNGEAAPSSVPSPAKVTITKCTANNNQWDGIGVFGTSGDVVITDCTANGNGEDGIIVARLPFPDPRVANFVGNVTITNCTANGNEEDGFDVKGIPGTATIQACIARDNGNDGVELEGIGLQGVGLVDGVVSVNGSIICGNECGLGLWNLFSALNAEGNWWGCPGGPEGGAGCDPICQEDSVQVDYTPWIDTVTASAPASVTVGNPALVSFQFSGGPPAVYLGEGPGDLRGPAPFTVSTDNGTVTGGFINAPNGVLEVTLVPAHGGTATVWVHGPCGLDASVMLEAWEFVPEPGSVVLLASGLMGLAGYAGLRWRSRQ